MSRTYRNRKSYVWWKKCQTWRDEGYTRFNAHDIVYLSLASRSWRKHATKPNGADGAWKDNATGRMKARTSRERRWKQRDFLNKFKAGYDLDNMVYPNEKQTKYLWWVFY